jgi:superfamily II DNA or RNA helicase
MLRDRQFKAVYRSESDNLLEDFYVPALKESIRYDRAVGFFSSAMLSYAGQGISALAAAGGQMRLIFGGELEPDEMAAIEDGYFQKEVSDRIGAQCLSVIENVADALAHRRLETLAWLVASGLLDIKVALKPRGMYHEKVGILYDTIGDRVVFQGSANETVYALVPDFNFESINVFQSWRPEHEEYAIPYVAGFERLWNNRSPGTLVMPFPEAAAAKLLSIGQQHRTPRVDVEIEVARRMSQASAGTTDAISGLPSVPSARNGSPFKLFAHQTQALNAWKANVFRGVLAMATGSGKTITALYGISRIYNAFQRLFVVISVPYQSLADQWVEELRDFGVNAVPCYADRTEWEGDLRRSVALYQAGALPFVACVVVQRTLQSDAFQQIIFSVPGDRFLLIGDECHYFGSEALCRALPKQAQLRLGLSATPTHYIDSVRNARVRDYFGDTCFTYSLADALRDKALTPYQYYVHPIQLSADETERYLELSGKISRLAAGQSADAAEESEDGALNILLFQRARLLGNAAGKITELRRLLEGKAPSPYTLFYCGDGEVEAEDEQPTRQIDEVSRLLYELGWRVSHFTAREPRREKQRILSSFRIGALDGLVAMKCLDEGIDVPACRAAYILASARNPKQFIQRRGRILRKSEGKEVAIVHDFLPMLPLEGSSDVDSAERRLIIAELRRISEFASLATNPEDVLQALRPILEGYDVLHFLTDS